MQTPEKLRCFVFLPFNCGPLGDTPRARGRNDSLVHLRRIWMIFFGNHSFPRCEAMKESHHERTHPTMWVNCHRNHNNILRFQFSYGPVSINSLPGDGVFLICPHKPCLFFCLKMHIGSGHDGFNCIISFGKLERYMGKVIVTSPLMQKYS